MYGTTTTARGKICTEPYNGYTAFNTHGLCPEGWHVPTHEEFAVLTDTTASILKSCRQVNSPLGIGCATTEHPRWNQSYADTIYGTDDWNFSALPAGIRLFNGTYTGIGSFTFFWTSTSGNNSQAYSRNLHHNLDIIVGSGFASNGDPLGLISLTNGFSVRCIKD